MSDKLREAANRASVYIRERAHTGIEGFSIADAIDDALSTPPVLTESEEEALDMAEREGSKTSRTLAALVRRLMSQGGSK